MAGQILKLRKMAASQRRHTQSLPLGPLRRPRYDSTSASSARLPTAPSSRGNPPPAHSPPESDAETLPPPSSVRVNRHPTTTVSDGGGGGRRSPKRPRDSSRGVPSAPHSGEDVLSAWRPDLDASPPPSKRRGWERPEAESVNTRTPPSFRRIGGHSLDSSQWGLGYRPPPSSSSSEDEEYGTSEDDDMYFGPPTSLSPIPATTSRQSTPAMVESGGGTTRSSKLSIWHSPSPVKERRSQSYRNEDSDIGMPQFSSPVHARPASQSPPPSPNLIVYPDNLIEMKTWAGNESSTLQAILLAIGMGSRDPTGWADWLPVVQRHLKKLVLEREDADDEAFLFNLSILLRCRIVVHLAFRQPVRGYWQKVREFVYGAEYDTHTVYLRFRADSPEGEGYYSALVPEDKPMLLLSCAEVEQILPRFGGLMRYLVVFPLTGQDRVLHLGELIGVGLPAMFHNTAAEPWSTQVWSAMVSAHQERLQLNEDYRSMALRSASTPVIPTHVGPIQPLDLPRTFVKKMPINIPKPSQIDAPCTSSTDALNQTSSTESNTSFYAHPRQPLLHPNGKPLPVPKPWMDVTTNAQASTHILNPTVKPPMLEDATLNAVQTWMYQLRQYLQHYGLQHVPLKLLIKPVMAEVLERKWDEARLQPLHTSMETWELAIQGSPPDFLNDLNALIPSMFSKECSVQSTKINIECPAAVPGQGTPFYKFVDRIRENAEATHASTRAQLKAISMGLKKNWDMLHNMAERYIESMSPGAVLTEKELNDFIWDLGERAVWMWTNSSKALAPARLTAITDSTNAKQRVHKKQGGQANRSHRTGSNGKRRHDQRRSTSTRSSSPSPYGPAPTSQP